MFVYSHLQCFSLIQYQNSAWLWQQREFLFKARHCPLFQESCQKQDDLWLSFVFTQMFKPNDSTLFKETYYILCVIEACVLEKEKVKLYKVKQ